MEIMELLVQIRTKILLSIITTFLVSSCIMAQHQIDKNITFNFKGKNNYVSLNTFLGNSNFDCESLGNCMSASGIIIFQVNPMGKIISVNSKGNLPNGLIEAIKKRIYLTEDCWVFNDEVKKKNKNIEFYYPIYVSIDLKDKCDIPQHESAELLQILFKNKKVLHIRDEIYFIAPDFWLGVR